MYRLQHQSDVREVHDAPLPPGGQKLLGSGIDKPKARVGDVQSRARKTTFLEVLEEVEPARIVLLSSFYDAEDVAIPFGVDADRHQQRDVPHLARPGPLQDDAVQVYVGVVTLNWPVPPRFDRGVDLLIEVRHRCRRYARAHNASVMSSTVFTETPARYISISASSTELSRRR